MLFILQCFYLMLPAYVANMVPVVFKNTLNFLDIPVDFGLKFFGKPLFGKNKTFRGFFVGIIFSILICFFQYIMNLSSINLIDYSSWIKIGFSLGFGSLLGDLIKSFFKRRINIEPGKSFFPFDQIDYSIGAMSLLWFFYPIGLEVYLTVVILSLVLHILINYVGYLIGVNKRRI